MSERMSIGILRADTVEFGKVHVGVTREIECRDKYDFRGKFRHHGSLSRFTILPRKDSVAVLFSDLSGRDSAHIQGRL